MAMAPKMVSLKSPASSALRASSPLFFDGLLSSAYSISLSSPQTMKRISTKAYFQTKGPPISPHGIDSVNDVNLKLRMRVMTQARRGFLSELRKMKEEEDFASELQYELPLKIVKYPDPRLRAKNKPINIFDEKLQRLADEMFDVMYKTDGVGLSAPQVGVNVQLMVFNPAGERGKGEEVILVNPEIYKYSKKKEVFTEGCLSFPEIYADVERPISVKIEAWDIKGKKFLFSLKEFNARIFQHEYDHLQIEEHNMTANLEQMMNLRTKPKPPQEMTQTIEETLMEIQKAVSLLAQNQASSSQGRNYHLMGYQARPNHAPNYGQPRANSESQRSQQSEDSFF